jgi:hypothetical protein
MFVVMTVGNDGGGAIVVVVVVAAVEVAAGEALVDVVCIGVVTAPAPVVMPVVAIPGVDGGAAAIGDAFGGVVLLLLVGGAGVFSIGGLGVAAAAPTTWRWHAPSAFLHCVSLVLRYLSCFASPKASVRPPLSTSQ